jgi:hypothetical protein
VSWTTDDAIDRARDDLARRAETGHPGWSFSHGLFGWTGKRTADGRTLTGSSLPALCAQISAAGARKE